MATTVYKPVHETTKTAKYDKVQGSYLVYTDEHTKVFMNKIEELCLFIH